MPAIRGGMPGALVPGLCRLLAEAPRSPVGAIPQPPVTGGKNATSSPSWIGESASTTSWLIEIWTLWSATKTEARARSVPAACRPSPPPVGTGWWRRRSPRMRSGETVVRTTRWSYPAGAAAPAEPQYSGNRARPGEPEPNFSANNEPMNTGCIALRPGCQLSPALPAGNPSRPCLLLAGNITRLV